MPASLVSFKSKRPSGTIELEGALHVPQDDSVTHAAVLCHPHPAGGGEMGVPLISYIAEELAVRGTIALRFNFGGVGMSKGSFTDGLEEPVDVAAACEYVHSLEHVDPAGISLCGWSFGAWMSLVVLSEGIEAARCVAIAPPLSMVEWSEFPPRLAASRAERLYIVGDRDQFCTTADIMEFASAVSESDAESVELIAGVDHFLFGNETDVVKLVADFLCR